METLKGARVDWAVGSMPHPAEEVLGDAYLVREYPGGMLLAVIDGIGHGPDAAAVARIAISVLEADASSPLASLITHCHQKLRGTRGATMTVASFDFKRGEMSWAGVGDVTGTLLRVEPGGRVREIHLLVRGGLLGAVLPTIQIQVAPVQDGDVVMLATDGIGPGFPATFRNGASPELLARRIVQTFVRGHDDALVLVGRYYGASS